MIRLSATELRKDVSEALNQIVNRGERIVLHRRNKDIAVLVSMEDALLLRKIEDAIDLELIRKAKEEPGEDVLWEEIKRELDL